MRVPRWALCAVWSESELPELGGMEHQRARRGAVGAVVGAVTFVPSVPLVPRPLGSAFGDVECVGVRGSVGSDATVMAAVGVVAGAATGAAPRATVGAVSVGGAEGACARASATVTVGSTGTTLGPPKGPSR